VPRNYTRTVYIILEKKKIKLQFPRQLLTELLGFFRFFFSTNSSASAAFHPAQRWKVETCITIHQSILKSLCKTLCKTPTKYYKIILFNEYPRSQQMGIYIRRCSRRDVVQHSRGSFYGMDDSPGGKKSAKYKMMMARGLILLRIKRCALRPLIYTISLSIVGSNPVCAVKK